uniref:Mitochondrial inner membrane protease subunit n=1 Tax=Paramormyrops kingsleyae TaxID=1676925 RepID=A0A3B3SHS2_9TELE
MAQSSAFGRRCARAFVSGFFVAVPVTVTVLDRLAYIARVEGASMQPSLNPEGQTTSDVVLLSRWSVRDYQVQRGDIVSLLSPKNPQQKIIKRVIGLEGDLVNAECTRLDPRSPVMNETRCTNVKLQRVTGDDPPSPWSLLPEPPSPAFHRASASLYSSRIPQVMFLFIFIMS